MVNGPMHLQESSISDGVHKMIPPGCRQLKQNALQFYSTDNLVN